MIDFSLYDILFQGDFLITLGVLHFMFGFEENLKGTVVSHVGALATVPFSFDGRALFGVYGRGLFGVYEIENYLSINNNMRDESAERIISHLFCYSLSLHLLGGYTCFSLT